MRQNKTPKEISFFLSSLRGGGAERVSITLANNFVKNDCTVRVFVLNLINSVHHKKLDADIELINLNVKHARFSFLKIYKSLKKYNIDTILVFTHEIAIVLILVRFFLFRKIRIIARNISTLSKRKIYERSFWHSHIKDYILKIFYKTVDHTIVQSNDMQKDLINNYQFNPDKLSVINNPLAPAYELESEKPIDYSINKNDEILFVGRLVKLKGLNYLFKAFEEVLKTNPGLKLRLIGEGVQYNELKNLAIQSKLENKIIFEGYRDDLIPYYKSSRVTVLTSLYEGFPNVLLESLSCGTPVVSFDCESGPNEIIEDSVNGFLVRYKNTVHLTEMIIKSLNFKWDVSNIKKSVEKYRIDIVAQKYLEVIFNKKDHG